jgi:hypothetical protein
MLKRIVAQGERPVLLSLMESMIRQGSEHFRPDATCCKEPHPSLWLARPGSADYVSVEDILDQVDRLDIELLRALSQIYAGELRADLTWRVLELISPAVYTQWAAPIIAASPHLARFTAQLSDYETYSSLLAGLDSSVLLASPLAEVTTQAGYNDNTLVFSHVFGRCFWLTLDRATFAPILSAFTGLSGLA